ncbi:MAG: Gfo/Idh/MocA family oxidoreductase [Rhodospirillaceae bacterium]|nr:Gfo/Idh/MocA family oxidoreductase [Rhodospirillaceae bacterium]
MIRWLVAGAGQAGRCHMAAIQKTTSAELLGVVDPTPPDDTGVPVYANLSDALRAVDADAIVIASPNDTQADLAHRALDANLPVLCEKPVGKTRVEAEALHTHAKDAQVPLGVVLNQRAQTHNRWISELIENGALIPQAVTFTGNLARLAGWHADPARSGGGVLRTIGLHYIDLLLWWLGQPKDVKATLSGISQEDCINVTMTFSSRCSAQVKIDAVNEQADGPVICIIEGEGVRIDMAGHSITSVKGLPDPPLTEPSDADLFFGPGHQTVIAEASRALQDGQPFPVPLSDVFPALEIVDDIYAVVDR